MPLVQSSSAQQQLNKNLASAGFPVSFHTKIHKSHLIQPNADRGRAIQAFREYLRLVPRDKEALENLAYLAQLIGNNELADNYRKQAITIRVDEMNLPQDEYQTVLQFMLAKEGLAEQPLRCPQKLIIEKFDNYAETFDDHLRNKLAYRGPEFLLEELRKVSDIEVNSLDILDLGCGTGISGEIFSPLAKSLTGMDFSAAMLEKAAEKGVYNQLIEQDIENGLKSLYRQYDLILAADVFIYSGTLESVFSGIKSRLKDDAWFVFSVEKSPNDDYRLHESGRYSHSKHYITKLANRYHFSIEAARTIELRKEQGLPVEAYSFVLRNQTHK